MGPGSPRSRAAPVLRGAPFGVSTFPYFVAVGATGEAVGRTSGAIPADELDQFAALARPTADS